MQESRKSSRLTELDKTVKIRRDWFGADQANPNGCYPKNLVSGVEALLAGSFLSYYFTTVAGPLEALGDCRLSAYLARRLSTFRVIFESTELSR